MTSTYSWNNISRSIYWVSAIGWCRNDSRLFLFFRYSSHSPLAIFRTKPWPPKRIPVNHLKKIMSLRIRRVQQRYLFSFTLLLRNQSFLEPRRFLSFSDHHFPLRTCQSFFLQSCSSKSWRHPAHANSHCCHAVVLTWMALHNASCIELWMMKTWHQAWSSDSSTPSHCIRTFAVWSDPLSSAARAMKAWSISQNTRLSLSMRSRWPRTSPRSAFHLPLRSSWCLIGHGCHTPIFACLELHWYYHWSLAPFQTTILPLYLPGYQDKKILLALIWVVIHCSYSKEWIVNIACTFPNYAVYPEIHIRFRNSWRTILRPWNISRWMLSMELHVRLYSELTRTYSRPFPGSHSRFPSLRRWIRSAIWRIFSSTWFPSPVSKLKLTIPLEKTLSRWEK